MSADRRFWNTLRENRQYTTSSWFITINTNKVTEEGRLAILRVKDYLDGNILQFLKAKDIQTNDFTVDINDSIVEAVRISGSPELSRDGRFHAHFDVSCVVIKPHQIHLDYDLLRNVLNEIAGFDSEEDKLYINAKLYVDNALRIQLYQEKQRGQFEYTDVNIPSIPEA